MRRVITFVSGMLFGAAVFYMAMNLHIIRATDGFHLVPKVNAKLGSTYVDIRGYSVSDWAKHAEIGAALINADRRDLLDGAFTDSFQNSIDGFLNPTER